MKNIFVVTVNFNSESSTKKLLESLRATNIPKFTLKIIVVDNGSEKVFELGEKEKQENVMIIRSKINTGFSGGNNIGIKEALRMGADNILLINNDTFVDRQIIVNLLKTLESSEHIGVTSPKIYFAKGHEFHKNRYEDKDLGKIIWFAGGSIDWKNAQSLHIGMDEIDHGQFDKIEKIDFATGCCMMIKKEVFEKLGLFDEKYFLYFEDADFSERVKKAGYQIYYVPQAIIYHDNAQSSGGSGSSLHDYFLTRNQMLFGIKYAPLRTKFSLLRQSLRLLISGRRYQKKGIRDYYLGKLGKGTYFKEI